MIRYFQDKEHAHHLRQHLFWGLGLIAVGSVFMADQLGFLEDESLWNLWPALVALHGLLTIALASKATHIVRGAFSLVLAFWLYACLENVWGWTFESSWPIIVIAYGVAVVLRGLLKMSRQSREESVQ